jgi:hypothetical protein
MITANKVPLAKLIEVDFLDSIEVRSVASSSLRRVGNSLLKQRAELLPTAFSERASCLSCRRACRVVGAKLVSLALMAES